YRGSGMPDLSFGRNHIVFRHSSTQLAKLGDPIAAAQFPLDGERRRKNSRAGLTKRRQQSRVLEFPQYPWANRLTLKPLVHDLAQRRVLQWQQKGCAAETARESLAIEICQGRRSKQGHAA